MTDRRPAGKTSLTWDQRLDRAKQQFPGVESRDFHQVLRNPDVFQKLLHDMVQKSQEEANKGRGRGYRPRVKVPDDDHIGYRNARSRFLAELKGEDYATVDFTTAFRVLAGTNSRTQVARKTGIGRTQVHRLWTGQAPPSPQEMEAIAGAYGKAPWFFVEYRSQMVAATVGEILQAAPETSVVWVQRLGLTRRQAG